MSPFWMLKAIGQETKRDWRVLDVGCAEGGRSKWFISGGCDVTGIDIKSYSNDYSERGLKFIQTSLEDYRPVQRFNVVVAMYVMPFVRCTWDERIAHLTRLMERGALLLLTVFAPDDGRATEPNIAIIGEEGLRDLLQRHKLNVRYRCHEQYEGPTRQGKVMFWSVIGVVAELGA
jgi:cyclopropane fatty-acyl-phospholipid synthase-like methyltransferase